MGLRLRQNVFLDINGFGLHFILSISTQHFFICQMFTSIGQSPCDVAVELASVCAGHSVFAGFIERHHTNVKNLAYQFAPISLGWHYIGPWVGYDNSCLCSSVLYSLLSACANCQGAQFLR